MVALGSTRVNRFYSIASVKYPLRPAGALRQALVLHPRMRGHIGYERGSGDVSGVLAGGRSLRLMDEARRFLRATRYIWRTKRADSGWIRRCTPAIRQRHPREMGGTMWKVFCRRRRCRAGRRARTLEAAPPGSGFAAQERGLSELGQRPAVCRPGMRKALNKTWRNALLRSSARLWWPP